LNKKFPAYYPASNLGQIDKLYKDFIHSEKSFELKMCFRTGVYCSSVITCRLSMQRPWDQLSAPLPTQKKERKKEKEHIPSSLVFKERWGKPQTNKLPCNDRVFAKKLLAWFLYHSLAIQCSICTSLKTDSASQLHEYNTAYLLSIKCDD
jgi:hypothetical protein